jgi:peptidoglycan/LPS O-acetylase OafA/YrhL
MGSAISRKSEHRSLSYMPQLDGLRTLAVICVWFVHWGVGKSGLLSYVKWGEMGVLLFFVLSGFLITSILLKGRSNIDAGEPASAEAKRFWARRFLRILPVYYLVLVCAVLLLEPVRQFVAYHATYVTNFYCLFVKNGKVPENGGPHFWSLAVEEQFYFIWPWVIFFLPRRFHLPLVVSLIAGAPAVRALCIKVGYQQAATQLPFCAMDALCSGALLAIIRERRRGAGDLSAVPARGPALGVWGRAREVFAGAPWTEPQERILMRICLCVGLPLLIVMMHDHRAVTNLQVIFTRTGASLVFVWLVAAASAGFRGPVGMFLTAAPIVYLGKISYGLYLYHMFIPDVLARLGVPLPGPEYLWARFGIYAAVTIGVASVSWYLFEKPINGLKRFFEPPERMKKAVNEPTTMPAEPTAAAAATTMPLAS